MCKIIPVLEKSREECYWEGWGGGRVKGVWTRSEKLATGGDVLLAGSTAPKSRGTRLCALFLPRECRAPDLSSMAEQNLRAKCQTCGSHRVAAEARCRPYGQRDNLRATAAVQHHRPFCCPQSPLTPVQCTTLPCSDFDSCQNLCFLVRDSSPV